MGFLNFLSISICLLLLFPCYSLSAMHFPRRVADNTQHDSVIKLKHGASSDGFDPTRVTQISWIPRAFHYSKFLSEDECDHLINLAKGKLEKSMVVDDETGGSVESDVRTSSGVFLNKSQDEIVAAIEARLATWTFLPEENGESMQILRYELGQKYEPHMDYFEDKVNLEMGGNRVATVLMYLSNVQKGGETVFPNSQAVQLKDSSWSDCSKKGYAVKPEKGDALLFFSLLMNNTEDKNSLHGSCPVVEGEKWSATKWIHTRSFDSPEEPEEEEGDCKDHHENCDFWASSDECKNNPVYMVGSEKKRGYCRKSCHACSS